MDFDKVIFDKVILDKVIFDRVIFDKMIFDKVSVSLHPSVFEHGKICSKGKKKVFI